MRAGIVVAVVAACGGDPVDLTGVYRVDSAVGSAPCGADTTIEYAAFVRFEKMDLFGTPYFSYDGCSDAAATDCETLGGLLGGFFEPDGDTWRGRASLSAGGGTSCALQFLTQIATLRGDALVIEGSSYQDEVEGLSDAECTPDEAERRGEDMPCVAHTLVDATRL